MRTPRPVKGYLICGEPRSGSSLLCRTLGSTGLLGKPAEYFRKPGIRARIRRGGDAAVETLLHNATSPNGVYGIKISSYQFDTIAGSGWIGRLPDLRFIHLQRRDLLGQAVSHVRALQTGRFTSDEPQARPSRYDRRAIAREMARLAAADTRWRSYFARNGIEPLRLVYEEMVADPDAIVTRVAAWLGLTEVPSADPGRVEIGIQRDSVSAEWRRRFVAEAGELERLGDWPFGPVRRRMRAVRDSAARIAGEADSPERSRAVPPADKAR